uniref:Msx2-interacting protein n=1 Tax=Clastoptera arizonana TaxID=38151 RepID=A0A1B6D8R2_9HEMI
MVRETRHLWVGNLPENIREDRIRDHFKRYGRVQSVKLLPRGKDDEGSGVCATVSFMDIKSASKAHNNEQKLEDRTLSTEYHEPAAIPGGSAAPIYVSPRFSHGPPEEISSFERSSHFYERERERRDGEAYLRRSSSTYHVAPSEPLRGRTRDRLYRNGPYTPIIESVVSRQPPHHRSVGSSWSYEASASRYPTASATTDVVYPEERREPAAVVVLHKKHTKSRSGSNGSESGSNSGSSGSRSRSSSSSSQSGSSSCSSASSSPVSDKSCSTHSHHGSLRSGVTLQSAVSTPHTNNSSPAVHSEDRRPLAICVRNLPARSSDTSLKDGLFHEYKKHGKVTWVKVVGQGSDRYALVCFKKPEDVEKALQVSHDKLFFGCKIEVAPYQGYDVDDNEFRCGPYEAEQDEFHPKATRTLFIGNLEKDITAPELRKHFDQFGEIIEIDIKKQGSASSYAFCQYCDIGSVVRAMRTLDGEHLGNNRIKLGFGKSMHTSCVWVDGVSETVSEKYLSLQFSQFGPVSHVAIDRTRGHALVFYEQISFAQMAVKEMRGVALRGRKLQVDFASRECQEAFYDHLEKQAGGHTSVFENSVQASPQGIVNTVSATTRGFETPSSSSSSSGGGSTRYNATTLRYTPQQPTPRSTTLYPRAPSNSGASPGASTPSPSTPIRTTPRHQMTSRFEFTTDYTSERRPYRSYEDVGVEDTGGLVMVPVGQGPPDIRYLQKERNALLEQLEDCASSGEEGGPRRRCKHRRSHSGEGGAGSRPGTPLCDERPENLPPVEPRRTPRERPLDPLSLPLPRFASQVLSPRPAPPSPPASPPRPQSSSSDDSEPSPPSPEWEERLRSLDEKYEKWSGSRTVLNKVDASSVRIRHKLLDLDLHELQPSEIVKSVLAKRSVFDEDSKRLENFGEKYEPREFVPSRPGISALRSRLDNSSPLHSPIPKSPVSSPAGGAKGLQYPFPSHPPVQPTTSVATTTAAMSLVSCAGIGSLAITTATCTIPSIEISKTQQTFSTSCMSTVSSVRQFPLPSLTNYIPPKISPPPPIDKKVELNEASPRGLIISSEKCKSIQKSPSPTCVTKGERCDTMKKELICNKQVKSCSRRESFDEKKEGDGRRRSRDETSEIKPNCLFKDLGSDIVKEVEHCERRKSVSDKRRESIDSQSESVSDKPREEERRRRESVDNSTHRDFESSEMCKARCNDLVEATECTKLNSVDSVNKPHERRKDSDDITRHADYVIKRDRRRNRDSVDSCSDNSKNREVPESIDKNKELESDFRHSDDKKEDEMKKFIEDQDKRKDSIKTNEVIDKRRDRENCDIHQENARHKERKEHKDCKKDKDGNEHQENVKHRSNSRKSPECLENIKHKDSERRKTSNDNFKHRDTNMRKESESSEDHNQKSNDHKKELDHGINSRHKDNLRRKDSESSDTSNIQNKRDFDHQNKREFDNCENARHKEHNLKKDIENNVASRFREGKRGNSEYDFSKHKDNDKFKESSANIFQIKEIDMKKDCNNLDHNKTSESGVKKDLDQLEKSRHKDGELIGIGNKGKFEEKKQDLEVLDVRLKEFDEKRKEFDSNEISKYRESDRRKDNDCVINNHFWEGNKKKDVNCIETGKNKDFKNPDIDIGLKVRDYEHRKDLLHYACENYKNKDGDKRKELENLENTKREEKRKEFEMFDSQRHKDFDRKKVDHSDNSKYSDRKRESDMSDLHKRKEFEKRKDEYIVDSLRCKENERRKEVDLQETTKHRDFIDKRRESSDKEKRKSPDFNSESIKSRESTEEKRKDRELDREKPRRNKDYEHHDKQKDNIHNMLDKQKENYDNSDKKHYDSVDKITGVSNNDDLDRKSESIKKDKRKDRISSSSWPAAIGCKRRLSSQDSLDICIDEAKRVKPERRDSKDSGRSSCSSKRSSGEKHNKSFTKMLEEKIREDREREFYKKKKEEEVNSEEKIMKSAQRKEKRNSSDKRKEERKVKPRPKENGTTASESEFGSGDEEGKLSKKHSIFDIVDDEPAYISMYDKVKARSTKNMQKQEEEKKQERLKEKFSQLKQSRAKREEKKRSTSYDEDSDSERGGVRRSNKLMITSSEEDAGSEGDIRTKPRKIMSDTSEDDSLRHNTTRIKPIRIHSEDVEPKSRKIMSDTSEDDSLRLSISRIKSTRFHSEDLDTKPRKILSDTSEDDMLRHNITRNKSAQLQSDESELDLGFEGSSKITKTDSQPKTKIEPVSDRFTNISEDNNQYPTVQPVQNIQSSELTFNRNSVSSDVTGNDVPRKKSHKKKQKKQKNFDGGEDGCSTKKHNSKKDRRKSTHSHDGEDDTKSSQNKIRKKKSGRESSIKRDEKMEDIFGTLSDDSDKGQAKWQVSQVYASDSDSDREIARKRDKRRKERKARELDEAGRALEAKLLETSDSYPQPEEQPVTKSKKKKRKKSRDEKSSKHHLHKLAEEDAAVQADSEREPEPPAVQSSLPSLIDSPPPPSSNQNKKPDIPGFGSQVDENIHETAVKSISESPTKVVEEKTKPVEPILADQSQDKPTPVISQEETEDAVAALLLEDSFGGGFESYPTEETPKPDTPVSEPDLQIDTDTEDAFDPIDFSRPPRTPDIPTFYRQQDTREGLEERILALACPDSNSKPELPKIIATPTPCEKSDIQKAIKPINEEIEKVGVKQSELPTETSHQLNKLCNNTNQPIESDSGLDLPRAVHPIKPLISEIKTVHVQPEVKVTVSSPQINEHQPLLKPVIITSSAKTITTNNPPPLAQRKQFMDTMKVTNAPTNVRFATCLTLKPAMTPLNVNVQQQQPIFQSHQIIQTANIKLPSPNQPAMLSPIQQNKLATTVIQGTKVNAQHQVQLKPMQQQHSPVIRSSTPEIPKNSLSPIPGQNINIQINSVPLNQQSNISYSHDRQNATKSPKPLNISIPQGDKQNTIHLSPHCQTSGINKLLINQQSNILKHQVQSNIHVAMPKPPSNIQVLSTQLHKVDPVSQMEVSPNSCHSQASNITFRKTVLTPQQGVVSSVPHSEPSKIVSPNDTIKLTTSDESKLLIKTVEQPTHTAEQTNVFVTQGDKVLKSLPTVPNKLMLDSKCNISQSTTTIQEIKQQQSSNQPLELLIAQEQKMQPSQISRFAAPQVQNCVLTTHPNIFRPTSPAIRSQIPNIINPISPNIKPAILVSSASGATMAQSLNTLIPPKPLQPIIEKSNLVPFEMARSPNSPLPQTVQPLRNDLITETPKSESPKQSIPNIKTDITNTTLKSVTSPVIQTVKQPNEMEKHLLFNSVKNSDEVQKKITTESNEELATIMRVENRITKPVVDEIKPMNAFIQDLTLKAAAAKNVSEDENKRETLKPIEQVVQQIHQRIRTSNSESKDAEKVNNLVPIELTEKIKPVKDIKIEQPDNERHENQTKSSTQETLEATIKTEPDPEVQEKEKEILSYSVPIDMSDKPESVQVDGKSSNLGLEPKVDKLILKKEDVMMCVDGIVAPLTPKMEKSNVFVSPGESSCEPRTQEMANFDKLEEVMSPETKEEKEEINTPHRGGRGGRRRKAGSRVGGVVTRRARLNNKVTPENSSATADVYEFRDDSEEESRPRLILTIKSPPEPSIVQNISPANNTRKSRRLQEKDGSRNTVDDTIEYVIRGTRNSSRRTTRAAAAASVTTTAAILETRKSPRRKQNNPQPTKELGALPIESKLPQAEVPVEAVTSSVVIPTSQPVVTTTAVLPSTPQPLASIQKPTPAVHTEPMTLIDPVTGLLIPMRESEEGQYIPVSSENARILSETHDENGEPIEKRIKISNIAENILAVSKPSTIPPLSSVGTPLPVRPGLPIKMPPNCAVVTPLPSKSHPIITKPNNISDIPRPMLHQSKPIAPLPVAAKPNVTIRTSTTIVAPTLTKPLTTSMLKPPGAIVSPPGSVKPLPLVNAALPLNRVSVPPPTNTVSKPIVTQAHSASTPHTVLPVNHKTHLLQAVSHRGKVPVAKVPTPLTPKAHILQSIGNAANCGAREGVVGPGTPPPSHHGALLTGSVASPPLRAPHHVSQQPIVTGASSTRVVCKNLLEPLKVEPGNTGCIVVPTPSPQSRGQVMQAGLPVPAYEASLGDVVQHVNYAPHHYVHSQLMYQQYLREAALGGYHLPSNVKPGVDIEEGAQGSVASPPLELRRGSPHDRTTDSPQVATVYVHGHGGRHLFYENPHPPPAHRPSQPRIQVSTPPHASQVPPQADSLLMLLQRYPVMWQGLLALKTDQAAVQMHFVFGNPNVARDSLPCNSDGSTPPLRIVQRMRLEQTQVDGVARKMQMDNEHCMLLALPCGRDHMDVLQQSNNLQSGFITYLQKKQAAGIVNIAAPGSKQAAYVIHIFPSCDFANESLARIAPDLLHRVANIAHLLIVIATV